MKINVEYFDNEITFDNGKINVLEIENKNYFYRFIKDLYNIYNELEIEEIKFFDNNFKEINMLGKIQIFTNYFNFEFDSKKYTSSISKYINNNISASDRNNLTNKYNKLQECYQKIINTFDLPLIVNQEFDINTITKMLKVKINIKDSLLENLLLLIDLESELKINDLLVFINLKQYLTKEELSELYKYSLYNEVKIILIDSQCYGVTNEYEKKLIIDTNLEEIMI